MPKDYDPRQTGRSRPSFHGDDKPTSATSKQPRGRERSRSPAPASSSFADEKARREAQRRAQMERLRAENEQEEQRLAALDRKQDGSGPAAAAPATKPQEEIVKVEAAELEGLDEEEQMRKLLGIEGFGSTKGQKVESNHNSSAAGAASKNKARKYRQYMNRKGGFNRPLDKME